MPAVALGLVIAGRGRGLRRVPDLSRVRLAVLAAVGAARCSTVTCRASTATARRPSTRCCCRSGSCSSRSATRAHGGSSRSAWRAWWRCWWPCTGSGGSSPACPAGSSPAGLLLTRLNFGLLASKGYLDIPYCALLTWAIVLEAERPRRGGAVWWLLGLAGLLRPEAWLLAGLYGLWLGRGGLVARLRALLPALAAPVLWAATDFVVTGDPLFSIHHTDALAAELQREIPLSEIPGKSLLAAGGDPQGAAARARGVGVVAGGARPAAGAGGARRGGGRDAGDLLRDRHAAGFRRSTATCCRPGSGCWRSRPTR